MNEKILRSKPLPYPIVDMLPKHNGIFNPETTSALWNISPEDFQKQILFDQNQHIKANICNY